MGGGGGVGTPGPPLPKKIFKYLPPDVCINNVSVCFGGEGGRGIIFRHDGQGNIWKVEQREYLGG